MNTESINLWQKLISMQWDQSTVFSMNSAGSCGFSHRKKKILSVYYLTLCTKINFRYIIDLNYKDRTIRFLGWNTEKYLCHLAIGRDFLKLMQKALTIEKE